ncbi:hypothetical protein JYQ62_07690 [Nostoc sp. UHCC 0702]|nr:hypothetical protein JYQ62_07690 [Nostoc sp. UHCC 0702]
MKSQGNFNWQKPLLILPPQASAVFGFFGVYTRQYQLKKVSFTWFNFPKCISITNAFGWFQFPMMDNSLTLPWLCE